MSFMERSAEQKKPQVVFVMGSKVDIDHAKKITGKLDEFGISWEIHAASAHKQPMEVLKILDTYRNEKVVVYVTIAGRSNALSGFIGANSGHVTIACPPFKDKVDMMVNINSTLQMPSKTPVLTVLDTGNCAICCQRILALSK